MCVNRSGAHPWIVPTPGLCPPLDCVHPWIVPIPGLCPPLDCAHPWIVPTPGLCPCCTDFTLPCEPTGPRPGQVPHPRCSSGGGGERGPPPAPPPPPPPPFPALSMGQCLNC